MNRSVVRLTLLALAVLMTLASPSLQARGRRYSGHGRSRGGRRGGGRGGYGGGFMQNPYAGYLNGAAKVTTANARYQLTIQQAKLVREQARRSALQTRRATLEEAAYEQAMRPQAEQLREERMQKALERSRHNPPAVEIWSGGALNALLQDIQTAQTDALGGDGAEAPLSPEILKHLNVTTGNTYGGIGLLRDDGKLTWPYALNQLKTFDPERKRLDKLLPQAVKKAHAGPVDRTLLNNIRATLKKLDDSLDAQVNNLTPGDYTAASRYLREVKDSLQVLEQSDVAKYFSLEWKPKGATVSELVQQMTREGLHFAAAVSGDESYYTSLYRTLVNYDLSVAQMTTPLLHTP